MCDDIMYFNLISYYCCTIPETVFNLLSILRKGVVLIGNKRQQKFERFTYFNMARQESLSENCFFCQNVGNQSMNISMGSLSYKYWMTFLYDTILSRILLLSNFLNEICNIITLFLNKSSSSSRKFFQSRKGKKGIRLS